MKADFGEVISTCIEKGLWIATAESCTGGFISSCITDVPGASECFMGGVIVYSNEMKEALLDVNRTVMEDHGAVSRETAAAMSEGLEELTGSDISISVTGIAGPAGGTDEKPVGTVYIGVKTKNRKPHVEGFLLEGLDRTEFKEEVSIRVLGMVLGHIDDM